LSWNIHKISLHLLIQIKQLFMKQPQQMQVSQGQLDILKEQIQRELNSSVWPRKRWSAEIFKKTPQERIELANKKQMVFSELRKFGYNPKKRMNLSESVTAKLIF